MSFSREFFGGGTRHTIRFLHYELVLLSEARGVATPRRFKVITPVRLFNSIIFLLRPTTTKRKKKGEKKIKIVPFHAIVNPQHLIEPSSNRLRLTKRSIFVFPTQGYQLVTPSRLESPCSLSLSLSLLLSLMRRRRK